MIIKETPWEERNLGVHGVELYFDHNDSDRIDKKELDNLNYNYQVVHLPINRIQMMNQLFDLGYRFIETKFEIVANLEKLILPEPFARHISKLSYYRVIESKDMELIYDSIKTGLFETDKVAVDPNFGLQESGRRYELWAKEEINNGRCIPYIVQDRNNNKIGFFMLRKMNEEIKIESFLAALFKPYRKSGLGFSVAYFPLIEAKQLGYKKVIGGVSSNNDVALKVDLTVGYQIKSVEYVLVKHL